MISCKTTDLYDDQIEMLDCQIDKIEVLHYQNDSGDSKEKEKRLKEL